MLGFSRKDFKNKEIEPHEILVDILAKKKEEELGVGEKKLEVPIIRPIFLFWLVSIFLISFLFFRTFYLQVIKSKEYQKLAQKNRFLISKLQAKRGVIYDRNLKQLVFNSSSFNLVCDEEKLPKKQKEREEFFQRLRQLLQIDLSSFKRRPQGNQLLILEDISQPTLVLLETKIEEFSGCFIEEIPRRDYLEKESFSHVLGYIGKIPREIFEKEKSFYTFEDYVGRDGIEAFYENILRRIPGELKIERDALGRIISQEIISLPHPGKSLILTLDAELQVKIKEALEKRIKEVGGEGGAGIAINPKNGEILALVSLPSFDLSLFSSSNPSEIDKILKDKRKPLFNRAISGEFLVGSIIKPLIAAAALEEKIVNSTEKVYCPGEITIPNPWDPTKTTIFHDWKTHGFVDLKKAIAESCNVYFFIVGSGYEREKGLGVRKIKEYLELFNWGKKTGIDLPGEKDGFLPDPEWKNLRFGEPWRLGDTFNLSIGQGFVLATPLQVAVAFSAIANGGKIYQPHLLKGIIENPDISPPVIQEIKPRLLKENFISERTLQVIKEGMRWAVTGENSPLATAQLLNFLPKNVAAKTGTAETWLGGEKKYHNWIVAFGPYEDPEIVLTLMIEGVEAKVIENQLVVVPVAKEILEWFFSEKMKN